MNYTGYLISEESRKKLAELYPPTFNTYLGHHITLEFNPKEPIEPEQPSTVQVIGYAKDDKNEGFLVEVDGTINRPAGGKFHITWSINKENGGRPAMTNGLMDHAERITPILIQVTPKIFTQSTEAYLKKS